MKQLFVAWLILLGVPVLAQVSLEGYVKDAASKSPIPYCAIGIKNKSKGFMSNEEGVFKATATSMQDTLVFTFIGYKTKTVTMAQLAQNATVLLQQKENTLAEIVVYGNDNYLYTVFENCRKQLLKQEMQQAKAYFVLETNISQQPVELLECYYNSELNSAYIKNLQFKNGRVGLAPYEGRFFVNRNTSKAITFLNLVGGNEHMPVIPFQLGKQKLKKQYRLSLKSAYDNNGTVYNIAFTPVEKAGEYFEGEVWIDKASSELKKITLNISNASIYPFLPMYTGKIEQVSMQVSKTFEQKNKVYVPEHIDFSYQLLFRHVHEDVFVAHNADTVFVVNSKGLMYFYDHGQPFILPYFNYNSEMDDYRKITSLTYNEAFWNNSNGLVYSDRMRKEIAYFNSNGLLMNYRSRGPQKTYMFRKGFFETNYILWSPQNRVGLKKDSIRNDTVEKRGNPEFISQRYKIKAQIFLDLNQDGDSLQHHSASVFDVYETFYNLREEPFTNCFINIYFDLVEIERRNMEKQLLAPGMTAARAEAIYKQSCQQLEAKAAEYFKQVERGKDQKELSRWNDLVQQQLDIDNMQLFGLKAAK